jgi:isoquinoline 1-oxidoreductase beta subunit
VFGGKVKRVDDRHARIMKGVRQIVQLDDCVAVVADHMGAAKKGLAALKIEWEDGPNGQLSTSGIAADLKQATLSPGAIAHDAGDVSKVLASGVTKVEATYQVPFLAHAAMEPMNCTVHVRKDGCDIWVGTQVAARAQEAAAKVTGLPLEKVVFHQHLIGGGFGRRLEVDGVTRATQIALKVAGPLKVVWTREEDIQHDMYRPMWVDRLSGALDNQGRPVAWSHRFAGSSVLARWLPPAFSKGLDPDSIEGAAHTPYALPNHHVEYVRSESGVPTAFWRSVGPSHNVFVIESFMDELAAVAKQDPVAYRLALLDKSPRAKAVLSLAAEKAGWGQAMPTRAGRGVSVQSVFGSHLAMVAEVEVGKDNTVRVRKVVAAIDCGIVVNPDTVRAQIESATIFGISAALYGEITLQNGRVEQGNFDSYRVVRLDEAPAIDVHIMKSSEAPGGIGEPGTSAVMPAVANAVFAATGKRVRKMPIDLERA